MQIINNNSANIDNVRKKERKSKENNKNMKYIFCILLNTIGCSLFLCVSLINVTCGIFSDQFITDYSKNTYDSLGHSQTHFSSFKTVIISLYIIRILLLVCW